MLSIDEAYRRARLLFLDALATGIDTLDLRGENLEELRAIPPEISSCENIAHLHFGETKVSDLSPLSSLHKLLELTMEGRSIVDLSPIANLPKLVVLYLDNTGVVDLSPLREGQLFVISLAGTDVRDLAPLAGMSNLQILDVSRTNVSDLSPLANHSELVRLNISCTLVKNLQPLSNLKELLQLSIFQTPVIDLRPLLSLRRLVDRPSTTGLVFQECAATQVDLRIAEIAQIDEASTRAASLFEYLENWEPPSVETPLADTMIPVKILEGRIEIDRSRPTEYELDDRVKRALHRRLSERCQLLAQLAGNEFYLLSTKARSLHKRLDMDFEEVDLLNVHLDLSELTRLAARGWDRSGERAYPQELADALADVVQDGPGLTLDHPDVEVLESRKARLIPRTEVESGIQERMAGALIEDKKAVGENLRALVGRTLEEADGPEAQIVQKSVHRNVLVRIGRSALVGAGAVMGAAATDLLKTPIVEFVSTNHLLLIETAALYGHWFLTWFVGSIASFPNLPQSALAAFEKIKQKRQD